MSSTIFPPKQKGKNNVKIKQLEAEIEALRSSTQQALEQSFDDANRIRDDIYDEVQKTNTLYDQIRQISITHVGINDADAINEIIQIIISGTGETAVRRGSCPPELGSLQDNEINDDESNGIFSRRRTKSFKDLLDFGGEVCSNIAGSIVQPKKRPSLQDPLNASSWHGLTNIFEGQSDIEEIPPRSKSSGFLNDLTKHEKSQYALERKTLESELINEIENFELLSIAATQDLKQVLREKDELILELELKIKSQKNQFNSINEAIERTKLCLLDSNLEVEFPTINETLNIDLIKVKKDNGLRKSGSFHSFLQLGK